MGKVSLSPQRRSFQRGCSWNTGSNSSSSSEAPLKTPPPTKHSSGSGSGDGDPHFKFDGQKPPQGGGSHAPRVIRHVPLHDQEQANAGSSSSRHGKKGGWRGEGGWKGSFRDAEQVSSQLLVVSVLGMCHVTV